MLSVDTDRVRSLDDALAALGARGGPYRVAWLDLLCTQPVTGSGHARRAHRRSGDGAAVVRSRATVPRGWPAGALRPATVRAFNALKYARAPRNRARPARAVRPAHVPARLARRVAAPVRPAGLAPVPAGVPTGAEHVLELSSSGCAGDECPCYLAVLKDFGPANCAPLSFPLAGWTLALDIPRAAPGLEPLLQCFDRAVAEAGGRVYLTKDARLAPDTVRAMYPRLDEWRAARDRVDPERVWCSDLARTGRSDVSDVLLVGGTSEIGLAIVRRLFPSACGCSAATEADSRGAPPSSTEPAVEIGLLDADDIAVASALDRAGVRRRRRLRFRRDRGRRTRRPGGARRRSRRGDRCDARELPRGRLAAPRVPAPVAPARRRGRSCCCRRPRSSVPAPPTRSTARPRPGSTRSPRVSPTRRHRAACACSSSARGSSRRA